MFLDLADALAQRIRFIGADATAPLAAIAPTKRLRLDLQSRQVWVGMKQIEPPLSAAQYGSLEFLHRRPDQVYSREEIVDVVWVDAEKEGVTDQAIDALVRRLRKRLAEGDPDGRYVITVRGHGFRPDPTGGPGS